MLLASYLLKFEKFELRFRCVQGALEKSDLWMGFTEHAPHNWEELLERRDCLVHFIASGMALQYLSLHLTQRGASWASGAAQAAQFVRIILAWREAV